MRKIFAKEVWTQPTYPDALHLSREGFLAVASSTSLHVMIPCLDPVEFEYCWVYIDQLKQSPPVLPPHRMVHHISTSRIIR